MSAAVEEVVTEAPAVEAVPKRAMTLGAGTSLVVLALLMRAGALRRPGTIIGAFALFYGAARLFCEFFREPDAQLGFLWGGLTMGIVLSVPLLLFGIVLIVIALKRPPLHAPQPA